MHVAYQPVLIDAIKARGCPGELQQSDSRIRQNSDQYANGFTRFSDVLQANFFRGDAIIGASIRFSMGMAVADEQESADARVLRLVREHARSVRGYLLGMVRHADVADDLLQEVFQRVWQARHRYEDRGCERAYLLRIADRLVVDRSRRLGVEMTVSDEAWQQFEPVAAEVDPVVGLAAIEMREELEAALARLSPAQRRVLLLRYFGELSFEEIAESLGCPLNTALSHARRGLLALRKRMTEQVP
jgi:RNA polymerase sigma-70 factor (ECF subfamily)